MIYLHTGCRYSESWDDDFQNAFQSLGVRYKLCNLQEVRATEGDIFFGRINESCLYLKENYDSLVSGFAKAWPEPLAMHLYNDKKAQAEFLQGYPTPRQEYVLRPSDITLSFPLVQKKREGSSSKNVKLVHSVEDLEFPCLLQEFCEGNDSDWRVNVIGDYVTGFQRMNRPNDFRASGSGCCVNVSELPSQIVDVAWEICRQHNFASMAFDFLKLQGEWVIAEMSYTYALQNVRDCNFYLDMVRGCRIDARPVPVFFILSKFIHVRYH